MPMAVTTTSFITRLLAGKVTVSEDPLTTFTSRVE